MTEPSPQTPTNRKGSESPPSSTEGDTQMAEGDSPPAVPPPPSGSTVAREPVKADPNESILALCERIGFPIDPAKVDADIADGSCTCQAIANAMANTRDRRAAGVTTDDGVLVSVPASVAGWLGLELGKDEAAYNAVVEALTPLMPEFSSHHGRIVTEARRTLEHYGFDSLKAHSVGGMHALLTTSFWTGKKPSVYGDATLALKWGYHNSLTWEYNVTNVLSKDTPHIVRPLEYIQSENPAKIKDNVIVYEMLEPLPFPLQSLDEIYNASTGLLKGLAAAHKRGVVHSDVCRSNIMRRPGSGEAVLIDFEMSWANGDWDWWKDQFDPNAVTRPEGREKDYLDCEWYWSYPMWDQFVPTRIRGHGGTMAPEILDGSYEWKRGTPRDENPGVDAWAAGAVIADWLIGSKYNAIGGLEPPESCLEDKAWRARACEQATRWAQGESQSALKGALVKRGWESNPRAQGLVRAAVALTVIRERPNVVEVERFLLRLNQ